jgi:hypothetical protein
MNAAPSPAAGCHHAALLRDSHRHSHHRLLQDASRRTRPNRRVRREGRAEHRRGAPPHPHPEVASQLQHPTPCFAPPIPPSVAWEPSNSRVTSPMPSPAVPLYSPVSRDVTPYAAGDAVGAASAILTFNGIAAGSTPGRNVRRATTRCERRALRHVRIPAASV